MLATVSALSAQNLGAGKEKRATDTLRYATVITTIYGVIVAVLIQFIAENVVGIFTSDTTVVTMGSAYIRSYIWDCIFAGIHFSFSGYFAACGKSYIGFLHNIISITFVRVPGSYLASKYFPDTLFLINEKNMQYTAKTTARKHLQTVSARWTASLMPRRKLWLRQPY